MRELRAGVTAAVPSPGLGFRPIRTWPSGELLAFWDEVASLGGLQRGERLVAKAGGPTGDASVGERNRWLVALLADANGPTVEAVVNCPSCQTLLDIEIDLPLHKVGQTPPSSGQVSQEPFRLPQMTDLHALVGLADAAAARRHLAGRCLGLDEASLAPELVDALEAAVIDLDPMVSPQTEVQCGVCNHAWRAPLDLVRFVWEQVDHAARSLLVDVHDLALAYGWGLEQSVAIGPRARRTLLELAAR
ncbi:MAG: hypothetical protein AAGA48_18935 [Myxococcota bacterium]